MTDWESLLIGNIDERADDLIALTADLIRIPSQNPPLDNRAVATFIDQYLSRHGLTSAKHEAMDGAVNVLAELPNTGRSSAKHLNLCGHSDVVPIGDRSRWDFDPFAGDIDGEYIRGRGASDMKAGLAGLMFVAGLFAEHNIPLNGRLTILAVPDEETGGKYGVPWMFGQGLLDRPTAAVIAEPSGVANPTIGQKGSCQLQITVHGTPGHGSLAPIVGDSAIVKATQAISVLHQLWDLKPDPSPDLQQIIDVSKRYVATREQGDFGAAFDHATLNIGTIKGGTATNVVADQCSFTIDSRVPFGMARATVLAEVTRLLADAGIEAEIVELGSRSEANWTLPSDPIVETLIASLQDVVNPDSYGVLQWATSDARWFRAEGVPVLQYGPAYLPSIHGFNEKAPIKAIIAAAKVYALTAIRYLGTAN